MKIQRIEIDQLFGKFDYKIPLDHKERITILHGPNGCGKTTVLKLIQDVHLMKFEEVLLVPFSSFYFVFKDETSLVITRSEVFEEDGASGQMGRRRHSRYSAPR